MDLADVGRQRLRRRPHRRPPAGVWLALVFGFGGVRDFDGGCRSTRACPGLGVAGVLAALPRPPAARRARATTERYTLEEGEPVEITIRGERRLLAAGQPLELEHVVV